MKTKVTSPLIEYRKTKNEKQTNFTLLKNVSKYGGSKREDPFKYIFCGLCFSNDFIFEILFHCYTRIL